MTALYDAHAHIGTIEELKLRKKQNILSHLRFLPGGSETAGRAGRQSLSLRCHPSNLWTPPLEGGSDIL